MKLGFITRKTNVKAHKIDSLLLETHEMISAVFLLQDNLRRVWVFEETFLLADISMKVVVGMSFLALSNADIRFGTQSLIQRSYTTIELLLITNKIELINKWEFAKAALDENFEIFVVHIAALETIPIHSFKVFQVQDEYTLATL